MSEARPLDGTVALVTGAAQGIGRATALELAADGATVVANDREPSERLDEVASICGGVPVVADVSDPAAVEEMVAGVESDAGSIGLLVANAAYMSMDPFLEHEEADWWRQVETNLSGTFYSCGRRCPACAGSELGAVDARQLGVGGDRPGPTRPPTPPPRRA